MGGTRAELAWRQMGIGSDLGRNSGRSRSERDRNSLRTRLGTGTRGEPARNCTGTERNRVRRRRIRQGIGRGVRNPHRTRAELGRNSIRHRSEHAGTPPELAQNSIGTQPELRRNSLGTLPGIGNSSGTRGPAGARPAMGRNIPELARSSPGAPLELNSELHLRTPSELRPAEPPPNCPGIQPDVVQNSGGIIRELRSNNNA